jgi:surface polysaccharide O-acyltransferase-like enzyme
MPANILENNNFINYLHYYIKSLFSICVPIFFFVNGLLLLNKPLNLKRHVYRTIQILFISIIWGFLTVFLLMIIRKDYLSLIDILKAVVILPVGWGNHLWYLKALVIIYSIFPLIKLSYDSNKVIFYYFLCLVFILTFGNNFILIVVNILEYVMGKNYIIDTFDFFMNINIFHGIHGYSIGYFLIGGLFLYYKEALYKRLNKIIIVLIIMSSLFFLTIYGIIMTKSNGELFDVVFDGYATIFTVLNVLGVSCLIMNYRSTGIVGKIIRIIGENTLGIYLLHVFIGTLLMPIYKSIDISTNLLINMLFAFIILMFSCMATLALKKIPLFRQFLK